jgi:hypothetical protein
LSLLQFPSKVKRTDGGGPAPPSVVKINYANVNYLEHMENGCTRVHFRGGGSIELIEGLPDLSAAMVSFLRALGGK